MSTIKNDGGPALPTTPTGETIPGVTGGMTLRDWFAGQALAGLCAAPDIRDASPLPMAKSSYRYADAMLAAREARR